MVPDDWQRGILDDWLAEVGGRWASLTCGLSVPRQNGKNGALEVRELFGMVGLGEQIVHTAHQVKTAQKHFRRLKYFFGRKVDDPAAKFPELNALVAEIRNVNGQEAIFLKNGGSVEIVARSQGSGRGFTVDVIVCDEAQDMSDDDQEALLSTSSASPLQDPQWIYTGTPPGPKANGEVFTRIRNEALTGKAHRHVWHEWSCEGTVDLDDVAEWHKANPALGGRVLLEVVLGERANLSERGFARERLGMWPTEQAALAVIPKLLWSALALDPEAAPGQGVPPSALAVDMSHDRVISIDGCWLTDTSAHVEILALDQPSDTRSAVEWLVQRAGRRIPVVIDSMSPAASMVPTLRARKVRVVTVSAGADMAKACGGFYDDATAGRLTHADQPQLNDALAGAKKRKIGDAGGWGWDRKDASVNLAPLVAATLARFGAVVTSKPKSTKQGERRAVVL